MKSKFYSLVIFLSAVSCGAVEEKAQEKMLLNSGNDQVQQETATPKVGDVNSESATDSTSPEAEVLTAQTQEAEEPIIPATPEEARLMEMGVDYFMESGTGTVTLFVREMDQTLAEAAIADITGFQSVPSVWVLKLRPDDEVLTRDGFRSPPPAIETILSNRGIVDYELEDGVLYVDEWQLPDALGTLTILAVFYPDIAWSAQARAFEPEEE